MPTIRVTDQFGFEFSVDPDPLSSLGRFLRSPCNLQVSEISTRLDQLPFTSANFGLNFEVPISMGQDAGLTVGTGVSGGIFVFVPSTEDNSLFEKQHYGEPVVVPADQAYVGVSFTTLLSAGTSRETERLAFGMDVGSTATIASYKRFSTQPAVPNLPDAIKETLLEFTIPAGCADLERMAEGAIGIVEGTGTVTFAGEAAVFAAANPLASLRVPIAGEVALKAGASVDVEAEFVVSCDYQMRVEKLGGGHIRLGYYKRRGTEFTVEVTVRAGLSAPLGRTDLLSTVLGAVSSGPVNADQLKSAGLSDDRIETVESTIRTALSRRLELAASFEFGALDSKKAAFLVDIDLNTIDADARRLVDAALNGQLSLLTANPDSLPRGLALRRSILSDMQARRYVLRVNIFGIYHLLSITEVLREGSITFDPVNGLSILDQVSTTRLQAQTASTGSEKLRKLLADFFLITAAYRGSKLQVGAPELSSIHTYFEQHARTNRQTMKDNLDIAEALGLIAVNETEQLLDGINDFGRTTALVETAYPAALCRRMFLRDDGSPRSEEEYEQVGLEALGLLVQADDPDAYRRAPVGNTALWKRMKSLGQPSFGQIFPGWNDVQLANVTGDYTLIRWWSTAMHETAKLLASMEALEVRDPNDSRFQSLRSQLAKHLTSVTKKTRPQWGDPWGLIAVDLLVGRSAAASLQITGPRVTLQKQRDERLQASSA